MQNNQQIRNTIKAAKKKIKEYAKKIAIKANNAAINMNKSFISAFNQSFAAITAIMLINTVKKYSDFILDWIQYKNPSWYKLSYIEKIR